MTSVPTVREILDYGTGVTITSNNTPLILYRDNASKAAYARNFVHLGPIQVNQSGRHRYFLWLGVWNTVHAEYGPTRRDSFESITLFANGEPLVLELAGWSVESIGASRPVYKKPVAAAVDAYYEVTLDQIRLIATANTITLRTGPARPQSFELWDDQGSAFKDLRLFVDNSY